MTQIGFQQVNLKDKLLMREDPHPEKHSPYQLDYDSVETEGECLLKSVTPIQFNKFRYYAFCMLSILLLGIPVVLVYWYPRLKLYLYYSECSEEKATDFAIQNYDDQLTIEPKQEEAFVPEHEQVSGAKLTQQYENNKIAFFINRYMKYRIVHEANRVVVRADIFDYETGIKNIINENYVQRKPYVGNEEPKITQLRRRFGPGVMVIEKPGILTLFIREIVRPLYFFILFSFCTWIWVGYFYYCGVIFVTSAGGIILNLYQTHKLNKKKYQMAYYETKVNVLRGQQVIQVSSKDLVPKDVVFLKQPIKIPFDGILLEGSALLNESALTGESVPMVRKAQEFHVLMKMNQISLRNNIVCQGTTLIQVDDKKPFQVFEKYRKNNGIPVYVIRTNFVTLKGQLIRIICFPIQKSNIFQKQSVYFLLFLFGVAIITYTFLIRRLYAYVQWIDLVQKFCDIITVTVPPGLPVSMTFGIIHAIQKLKKKNIFCVSPNKVITGGLVDFICFDKTGTLTQDFMDFKCLVPSFNGQFQASIQNKSSSQTSRQQIPSLLKSNPYLLSILANMATNHTIVKIQKSGENIGDPMQLKLFQFGQYDFNDSAVARSQLQMKNGQQLVFGFESKWGHQGVVVRRMDFDSDLLRMSVVAKSINKSDSTDSAYYLYTKGSPESIYKICTPATLPRNYDETLKQYASSGFRVLGIAHRKLSPSQISMDRLQLETSMQFDGFEIFQNRLKPETKSAVGELLRARIPCVMITGDNALTGCNMSYKCRIANRKKKMFIFNYKVQEKEFTCEEFKYEAGGAEGKDAWDDEDVHAEYDEEVVDNNEHNQFEMKEINNNNQQSLLNKRNSNYNPQIVNDAITQILHKIAAGQTEICLTGSAYALLFSNIDLKTMDQSRKTILKSTKVYARAKPNDKARIVMSYQQGLGKVVSMCGDGANDCGALKQSDAGLSLSQTQASISAPFTSKVANVGSMVQLIKECRAGLITNFSLFNIMAMYSLIQYTSSVICQYFFSYPSDFEFLYWDMFGNFFFFLMFGYTGTADTLSQHKPSGSLFTVCNLGQVALMYLTQLSSQLLMIFSLVHFFPEQSQYWDIGGMKNNYQAYKDNDNSFTLNSIQASVLFLFTNFMYIFSFIAFSISKPWRKQFYTNIPFMVIFVLVLTYDILLVIVPSARLKMFLITGLTHNMVTLYILLVSLIFGVVMYVNQKFCMEKIMKTIRRKYPNKTWI